MRALLLLLCLLSAQASGLTFFVRPNGACVNNGNGTAYGCAATPGAVGAWIGTTQALYNGGAGTVQTGDTLRVCGTFTEEDSTTNAALTAQTPGSILDGDCTGSGGSAQATLNSAGSDNYGIYCITKAECEGQTWRNFIIAGYPTYGVYIANDFDSADAVNWTGTNLDFQSLGNSAQAIRGFGTGATATDITITGSVRTVAISWFPASGGLTTDYVRPSYTWYVRPVTGSYGAADGWTYATAYDGTASVVYDASNVTSGDTLKVCGEFTEQDSSSNAGIFSQSSSVVLDGDCSSDGDLSDAIINAAGTANYGIYCNTAAECLGQTWKHFVINDMVSAGLYIRADLNENAVSNFTATDIKINDSVSATLGTYAIEGRGSGATFTYITTNRSTNDSLHWEGDNLTVTDSTFNYPAYNETSFNPEVGDCVNCDDQCDNFNFSRNVCNHTNASKKQCFIADGDGSVIGDGGGTDDNGLMADNYCYFPLVTGYSSITKPLYSDVPNTRFLRNFVSGGAFGIYALGASSIVDGNILVGQTNRGIDVVDTTTTGNKIVTNNTVMGADSQCFHIGGAGNTAEVYNNSAVDCDTGYVKNATPTITQSNNAVYNSTTNESGGFGTIEVTGNPLFVGGTSPTTAAGFKLTAGSPLRRAGTCIPGNIQCIRPDYRGYRARIPPDIGAYQYDAGDN